MSSLRANLYFSHPQPQRSRVNAELRRAIGQGEVPSLKVFDLYEMYPDFEIDVAFEKQQLLQADLLIFQHPFYWYSCPPIMKQWIDRVLEVGFAYGPGGNALVGKKWLQVISAGGGAEAYRAEGSNHYTMEELLRPFERTAKLCGMQYLEPLIVYGARRISDQELDRAGKEYVHRIQSLLNGGGEP